MRISDIHANTEGANASLEDLNKRIDDQVKSLSGSIDEDTLKELETQITDFSRLAIDQIKARVEQRRTVELSGVQTEISSERTKTLKTIEAFMATSPFVVLEKTLSLKLLDGAYEARGVYRCAENIQYGQLLDTKKSKPLSSELRISSLGKEVKIPISLAKNWLRKEQVPEYEKVDSYVLQSAEADANHLITTFRSDEKNSSLRLVHSTHDSHSSLTVELIVPPRQIDITSNAGLNRFLDTASLEKIAEKVREAILDLENYKAGIVKLVVDDQSVLEKLDLFPFFAKAWKILSPKMVEEIGWVAEAVRKGGQAPSDDVLNEEFVREKASSLGQKSKLVLQSLNMSS